MVLAAIGSGVNFRTGVLKGCLLLSALGENLLWPPKLTTGGRGQLRRRKGESVLGAGIRLFFRATSGAGAIIIR